MGNVRVSFTREGAQAAIVEKNDYYAFGLKHGNPADTSGLNYNYEYNGKELQQEIGMYDYGARFYMPDIGRWGVVDPLAEMYRRHSPYNYAVNNPMRFIDPDGMAARGTFDAGVEYTGQEAIDLFNAIKNLYVYNDNSNGDIPASKVNSIDQSEGGSAGGGVSSPTFQFSKETEKFYKEKYPKFYNFVMNILPNAIKDEKFISILSKTSGFSIDELAKMFSSDSAYGIIGYQEIPFSIADYPHGDRPTQFPINLLRLNNKTLDWFESANIDTTTFEGIRNVFQMVGYVGHEINHWGESAGTRGKFEGPGDAGDYFEHMLLKLPGHNYIEHRLDIGDPGTPSDRLNYYIKENFKRLSNIFNK